MGPFVACVVMYLLTRRARELQPDAFEQGSVSSFFDDAVIVAQDADACANLASALHEAAAQLSDNIRFVKQKFVAVHALDAPAVPLPGVGEWRLGSAGPFAVFGVPVLYDLDRDEEYLSQLYPIKEEVLDALRHVAEYSAQLATCSQRTVPMPRSRT